MHYAAHAHRTYKSFLQTLIRIICAFIIIVDPHSNTCTVPARSLFAFQSFFPPPRWLCWWGKFSIPASQPKWEDIISQRTYLTVPTTSLTRWCRVWENFPSFQFQRFFHIQHIFLLSNGKIIKVIDFSRRIRRRDGASGIIVTELKWN